MSTVDIQTSGDTDPMVLTPDEGDVILAAMTIVAQANAILLQIQQSGVSAGEYAAQAAVAAATAIAAANRAATGVIGVAPTIVSDANYTAMGAEASIRYTALTATRTVTLPDATTFLLGGILMVVDESGNCSPSIPISVTPVSGQKINGVAGDTVQLQQAFAPQFFYPTAAKDGWFTR